jgi:hypothetical protein
MKKIKKHLLFCICFFCAGILTAQESNKTIDSLLNVVEILSSPAPEIKLVEGADTTLINTFNLLSVQFT